MQSAPAVVNEFQDDLVFGTPDLVNREATRYLFFPGDVLAPRRKQERRDLAHGGEEFFSACMWRSRYFLRRGRITPLEYGARYDIIPRVPDGIRGIAVVNNGTNPTILEDPTLVGIPAYPGEELGTILGAGDDGLPMGVVELTSIRAETYADIQKEGYQKLFFPDYPSLPPTLSGLVGQIKRVDTVDPLIRDMRDEMLLACDMFFFYGTAKVDQDHQLMRQPTTGGYAFGYSPLAETLLPQLEIPRQDQGMRTMAKLTDKLTEAVINKGADGPNMEQVFALMKDNQEALVAAMSREFAKILEAKPTAKSVEKPEAKPKEK